MPQPHSLPTYHKALLQVLAYKNIQAVVNACLQEFNLNTTQWIILSLLGAYSTGLRPTDLAVAIQVEVPFVTALVQPLIAAKLMTARTSKTDRRAKVLLLATAGRKLIERIEHMLIEHLRPLEKGISSTRIADYFKTLELFIANTNPLQLPK